MIQTNIIIVGILPENWYVSIVKGYRGVDREYIKRPTEFYGTQHQILDSFEEYEELISIDGFLHDIDFARELRDIYNQVYPNICREILEITFNNEQSKLNGIFIGFDISSVDYSRILRVILVSLNKASNDDANTTEHNRDFYKILSVISHSVAGLLNENQLFKTYEDANMVLNLIEGTFEIFEKTSPYYKFEVTGIYLVE